MKEIISTPNAPAAIGPYSQAVKAGNLLFISGQIPLDPATGTVVEGDVTVQATRVLENVKAILTEAGADFSNVVKTTVFLKDMKSPLAWALLSGVFGLLFGALCGIVDVFIGGFSYAVTKWVSGIPFDIAHCAGNFVIALLLFKPLRELLAEEYAKMGK